MLHDISYLCISDIHLGHKSNKTEYIVDNLHSYFQEYDKLISKVDIIFIAGDIFDTLLSNNSYDYLLATSWLTELITYCQLNKIKLRILEGTPSHDWHQAKLISTIVDKLKIDIDYRYITTLYIEDMKDLGIHILYIPDEYKPKAKDTYQDVISLMGEHGISMVDIAIMHGQFNYQLPMVKLESSHNEDDYLKLVRYYINIGHIHVGSIYNRIIANGSFDRLAHGEEGDKGAIICYLHPDGSMSFKFLINKHAMVYKSLDYSKEYNVDKILKHIDKDVKNLKENSQIRLILNSSVMLSSNIKTLKDKYPYLNFKILTEDGSNKLKLGDQILEEQKIESFSITKDNIKELLYNELKVMDLSKNELDIIEEELSKVI